MIKRTGINPTLSIILATGLLMSIIGFHTNLNSFGTFPDQPTAQLGKGQPIPQGKFEADANTIALWHFDESNRMTKFFDLSGNGRNLVGKNGISTKITFAVNGLGKLTTTWAKIKINSKK